MHVEKNLREVFFKKSYNLCELYTYIILRQYFNKLKMQTFNYYQKKKKNFEFIVINISKT